MKKKYLKRAQVILLAMLCGASVASAQITFQEIYPSTIHESGRDVLQTSDGGYIIAASTETSIVNDLDVMVVRTDAYGTILWKQTYGGGSLPEVPNCILKAADGNYFIVGYSQSTGSGDFDHYLLKIDPAGTLIFSKRYGGYGNEDAKEIIATADGNYMIVGASNSVSFSDNNVQLIKIDISGNVIATKNYGGPGYESARSVKQCSDGGFIVAGKRVALSGIASIFLIRTNPAGDTLWTRIHSDVNSMEGKSILVNSDNSYTLSVDDSSATVDSDVRVMKLDPSGSTILWNKRYGGNDKDITKLIKPTSDGGYIVTAMSRSFGWIDPDYWLLKINSVGDTAWSRHYGGADHEHCYAVKETSDGGYITVGHTRSNPPRIEHILFIKLNSNGELGPVGIDENALNENALNLYPNPSTGIVNINFVGNYEPGSILKITDTMGKLIYSQKMDGQNNSFDLKNNRPGLYYISMQSQKQSITKKLILN
ncbi:MAG TPA: T9SS type A sorting domain-containing protein [Bacteroidia bacterium]|jgi:hypothetical protein